MLVPYLDMVNHSSYNVNADVEKDVHDNWTLFATKRIKKGEQIFISYMEECSSIIFITYGFVDDSQPNPYEKVLFSAGDFRLHDRTDKLNDEIVDRIISTGVFNPNDLKLEALKVSLEFGCSWGMQKAAVLAVANSPADLNCSTFEDFIESNYQVALSDEIKNQANQILVKVLRSKIRKFNQSIDDLLTNCLNQEGNENLKKLLRVEISFLEKFLNDNPMMYTLVDLCDMC